MKEKSIHTTCSILKDYFCKDCGWPVIDACCNDEMADLHPDEEWWIYCSNQGCKNHSGEPYSQEHEPSFLKEK